MRRVLLLTACITAIAVVPASATVTLIARGTLAGTTDLSGLTNTLENGLAANILGGLGSGLTYVGNNRFLAVPDRGPNATPYNSAVDDTVSYISRFQTVKLGLTSSPGPLPFQLTTSLRRTTLLASNSPLNYGTGVGLGNQFNGSPLGSGAPIQNTTGTYYFSGRSDNFGPGSSLNPADARFDPEAVRVSNDGRSVFISDEYGPYVRQFDRNTGRLIRTFALPANLAITHLSSQGAVEINGNAVGRVANKGMEGLAITPDGKTLVGIIQAPLEQDAAIVASNKLLRIVTIDIATGTTHEYGYKLTTGSGVSDIVAISNTQFLVDERDGKGLGDGTNANVKQLFKIDLAGAVDITDLTGAAAAAAAVAKPVVPFLDLVTALVAAGFTKAQIPAKIEGITFGQDVVYKGETLHTLFISNDNDFVPGVAGPNQFFVFGFRDSDLPGYQAQSIATNVPEPASWALMVAGFGLVGGSLRRRARSVQAKLA